MFVKLRYLPRVVKQIVNLGIYDRRRSKELSTVQIIILNLC